MSVGCFAQRNMGENSSMHSSTTVHNLSIALCPHALCDVRNSRARFFPWMCDDISDMSQVEFGQQLQSALLLQSCLLHAHGMQAGIMFEDVLGLRSVSGHMTQAAIRKFPPSHTSSAP